MREHNHAICNVCRSRKTRVVAFLRSAVDGKEYKAVRCRSCSLVFADPIPDLSLMGLQDIYGPDYTEGMREPSEDSQALRVLRAATHRQMDIVERHIEKGLVLNVGAMSGAIQVLEERGWKLRLVEPSQYAANTARERWGFDVTVCKIEDFQCPPATFDFIKLGHVIEHLPDPRSALARLCAILRPGGVILIDTDNVEGLRTRIEVTVRALLGERFSARLVAMLTKKDLRRRYGRLFPPVHLYSFSESSLVRLLGETGLEVIRVWKPAWGDPTWFPLTDSGSLSSIERAFIRLDQFGALFGSGEVIAILARKRVT